MLLLISVVLGILAGAFKKGRLARLGELRFVWLPIIAFAAAQLISIFPQAETAIRAAPLCVSYLCVLAFTWLNRRYLAGSLITALGSLCNFLVIALNGFRMPVSESALDYYPGMTAQAVLDTRPDYFIALDGDARLLFLGDVVLVPLPGIGGFISVGDILLALGVGILIYTCMTRPEKAGR